jgi:hypothetical protein
MRPGMRIGYARAVSQLLWTEKDREVWFSLGENHEKACRFPDFLRRSTSRGQLCDFLHGKSHVVPRFHQPLQEIRVRSTSIAKLL